MFGDGFGNLGIQRAATVVRRVWASAVCAYRGLFKCSTTFGVFTERGEFPQLLESWPKRWHRWHWDGPDFLKG